MNIFDLPTWSFIIIIPVVLWSLFWKALALWHAARRGDKIWFGIILVINSVGILEIIYLIITGRLKLNSDTKTSAK